MLWSVTTRTTATTGRTAKVIDETLDALPPRRRDLITGSNATPHLAPHLND
jgi:hypothetical protein